MLQVSGLQKRYGDLAAVKNVSFEVARGERFGLLGPNGAGKTTTISMITGTLDPDGGEAKVDGETVTTSAMGAKRKIGYVPQEIALYDEISARDNLRFFGALYGLAGLDIARASDRALEIAGLRDRDKEPVKNYSGGMKRRLNIAVALLHDPELLVFDEPTVGVDPQSRNLIFETLLNLADEGKTIIYTTHYMEEVERLCQRAAVMDHGEVVAVGSMADLQRMLGQEETVVIDLDLLPDGLELPGAKNVRLEGQTLSFQVDDLTDDLPHILIALRESGARITSIKCHSPSLEEVFLHLTGRSMRD
ncbi:ABC transporter ATP-binding protein [Fimbriimonas ginsengisoli]|uniref:ABC transporter related protein n=1 Tax=Fimbriimonas ginsengisoli Gsoil 348 TaxID=661478 RepID=A0A068NXM8_FIMGI|nr:ABC transporter ATP-binding protein [Fimbriimonas ginsengisoli]AIE88072.1 ABC transporter related protein [Fimbriimonas ginsengisoli Gsoil 348]